MRRKVNERIQWTEVLREAWKGSLFPLLCLLPELVVPGAAQGADLRVVTVPFLRNPTGAHEVYHGGWLVLQGVVIAPEGTTLATAEWDPGDGKPPGPATGPLRALQLRHQYFLAPGSKRTPRTARLTVRTGNGDVASGELRVLVLEKTLDVEIRLAIDHGLWHLHREMNLSRVGEVETGYWPDGTGLSGYPGEASRAAATASAVLAFEVNGHFEKGDPLEDPYAEDVSRGLAHLFTELEPVALAAPPATEDQDQNRNGVGLQAPGGVGGYLAPYVTGQLVDAIVNTCTPDAEAATGIQGDEKNKGVKGRRYFEIVQDMIDMYAWGQAEAEPYRGGWRYFWNSDADNSACQWAAIAALAVERTTAFQDRVKVPESLKVENLEHWVPSSQNFDEMDRANYGMFGYTNKSPVESSGMSTTASGLLQLILDGVSREQPRFKAAEDYLEGNWYLLLANHRIYGMFSAMKAFTLAIPEPVRLVGGRFDWFRSETARGGPVNGLARHLIDSQGELGRWDEGSWPGAGPLTVNHLSTAWAVTILSSSIIVGPVADCRAEPQTAENEPILLDGRQSFHLDPSHQIVLYEWDCDNDGTFEKGGPDMEVSECTYGTLGEHFACLRVTDDSVPPLTSQAACCKIDVVPCPRPPNSHPGGPYCFCTGVHPSFLLDGSLSSVSPCRTEGGIASYSWDFKQPLDRSFDDAVGARVNVTEYFAGLGPGTYSVELRVVDDLGNEDTDATTITISSRADCGKHCPKPPTYQIPGDANQDGKLDISDGIWLLEHLFLGAERVLPCEGSTYRHPGAGDLALLDWNGDGALSDSLDISDPICFLSWFFLGGCKEHPLGKECTLILGCPDKCAIR